MNKFHWIEAKQLDRVTNYSTEVEPIKYALKKGIEAFYYCTFSNRKTYYGLQNRIKYLGFFKNRYVKALEFQVRVVFKALIIVLSEKQSAIMVNQELVKHMLPALFFNKLFKRNNKFLADVRTTPVETARFNANMEFFHNKFKYAVKYFDGLSFITPFMEQYVMQKYNCEYSSVNWSSGVNLNLFNPENCVLDYKKQGFRVFYHGGISISRGNLDLIKAVHKLVLEGYDINLVQIGITVDEEIKNYIEQHQIQHWCKLKQPIALELIPQEIFNSDLPIMPFPNFLAWRVSSPIKLMEYLAMGKKILVPDMEAFTDVLGKETSLAYYYDTKTKNPVNTISEAIRQVYDSNELSEGNNFAEARVFVKKYTWSNQAQKLFDFAESLWEK